VLPVGGQRDAEAGDRVEILPVRGLDDPPQAADRAGGVTGLLQQGGEALVRVRMIRVHRQDGGPVAGRSVEQAELLAGRRRQRVQIAVVRMFAQRVRGDPLCVRVVTGLQEQARQLYLHLCAIWEAI